MYERAQSGRHPQLKKWVRQDFVGSFTYGDTFCLNLVPPPPRTRSLACVFDICSERFGVSRLPLLSSSETIRRQITIVILVRLTQRWLAPIAVLGYDYIS